MPTTKYATSDGLSIAYQVFGDGPRDLVYVPGWISNIELMWDDPVLASILRRLGSFARVITFDKRGTGMSDRVPLDRLPGLEERMDDVRAVMDEVGSERDSSGDADDVNHRRQHDETTPDAEERGEETDQKTRAQGQQHRRSEL